MHSEVLRDELFEVQVVAFETVYLKEKRKQKQKKNKLLGITKVAGKLEWIKKGRYI